MGEAAPTGELVYLRTPPPEYVRQDQPIVGPPLREMTESGRIGAAIAAVRRTYSGAVAEVLVDTLRWHQSTTSRVNGSSLPARLVTELLRPQ